MRQRVYDGLNPSILPGDKIKLNGAVRKVETDVVDRDAELTKLIRTRTLGLDDLHATSHSSFVKVRYLLHHF